MSRNASSTTRNSIIAAFFFALCWAFLFFVCPFHLVYKEQLVLFLCDRAYLASLLAKPAFAAVLTGDFLTQLFIYKSAAVTVTIAMSMLMWDGIRRLLAREGAMNASLCALIPTAVSVALSCQTEYPLSMTVGAAIAVWMAYGCSSIRNNRLRAVITAIAAITIYPVSGAHSLLFVLFASLHERRHAALSIGILIAGTAIVLAEGHAYNMIWQEAVTYPLIHGYTFTFPFLCLGVEIATAAAFAAGCIRRNAVLACALTVIAAAGLMYHFHDAKGEYDLKISTMAYFGKWNEVETMGAENRFQSQTGAYYYNLAMSRRGRLADELLNVYQPLFYGLFLPVTMNESYMKVLSGADALIECGDYGQAQHSAMLGMTFMPDQRSSRAVRKLAEVAIYNGDTLAARRYLGMLGKTVMHRKWAAEAESMLDDGTAVSLNNYRDTVYFVNDYQVSLRNVLDSGNAPDATVDYLLCYDLLTKNLPAFLEDYDRYYTQLYRSIDPPRVYQEALEMMEAGPEYKVSYQVKSENQLFLSGREHLFQNSYWFYFKYAQPGNEN